jgi:hypothetical protein
MSIALAQGQKGEGGQKEMSQPPAVKEGSAEKDTPKAGERRDAPKADKQAQDKPAKDASKDAAKGGKQEPSDRDQASKDTPKDGKNQAAQDRSKQAADKDKSKQATGRDKGSNDRVANLTQEQRTKVKSSFAKHRGKSTNVNIRVSIGVAVPRSVQLYAVPEEIVVIVPEYRRYRYFIVDDRICIVDPDTYEIVEIIVLV